MNRTAEERASGFVETFHEWVADAVFDEHLKNALMAMYRAGMEEAARVAEQPEFRFVGGNKDAAAAIRERMESETRRLPPRYGRGWSHEH